MTRRIVWAVAASVAALSVGGCGLMPAAGPEAWNVRAEQTDPATLPYAFVPLTPPITEVLAGSVPRIAGRFADHRGPDEIHFGIGDVVSVTLYESAAGGLFIPADAGTRSGNFIVLPNQTVDSRGNISIPYAGTIVAKNRTAVEIQKSIIDALKGRALEPQAVVALIDQRSSSISVLGDVGSSGRYPASASGERLLDMIARAGGPRSQGYDEWVMLERDGRRATVPFGLLVDEPENNIYVRPHDVIYVYSEPQTFVGFGASERQGQFPFGAWRISLAEAVAKMSGLNDNIADPGAVFIYRLEPREVAEKFGIDLSRFSGPSVPVIYNVNFRDPTGYFLATKFRMRNKDLVYTANSVSAEASKVLTLIVLAGAAVNAPLGAGVNGLTIKALASGASAGVSTSTNVVTSTAAAATTP